RAGSRKPSAGVVVKVGAQDSSGVCSPAAKDMSKRPSSRLNGPGLHGADGGEVTQLPESWPYAWPESLQIEEPDRRPITSPRWSRYVYRKSRFELHGWGWGSKTYSSLNFAGRPSGCDTR